MHLKRWLTSIAALPPLFLLILKGGPIAFSALIGMVCLISLWEFFAVVSIPTGLKWTANPLPWLAFISSLLILGAAYRQLTGLVLAIVALNLLAVALLSLPLFGSSPAIVDTIFKQCLGVIYIPLLLSHLIFLRSQPLGMFWVLLLVCVVFSGDIGAFYVGTYLGRHKLCPAVSPGKTWEGALGGLLMNLGAGALFKPLFLPALAWTPSLFLFAVIGVAGIVGDLFQSELKRTAGVKDSGIIFPGHGGMLDRIDALLFAAPAAYYFKILFLIGG